jgi:hypothetical protein
MSRCLVRAARLIGYPLFALALAVLTVWYVPRPGCPVVSETGEASEVAERLAERNGWEVQAAPTRPRQVFFLVDPRRHDPSDPLSFLRTTGAEWKGVIRIEVIRTYAGEVVPAGGFVWRGLWFYGDQGMLDRIRPELRKSR